MEFILLFMGDNRFMSRRQHPINLIEMGFGIHDILTPLAALCCVGVLLSHYLGEARTARDVTR